MRPGSKLRFLIALGMFSGATGPVWACKCAVTSRAQATAGAQVVFEGRVVNIATRGTEQLTTLAVVRSIKGATRGATVKVKSRTESAACGYDFRQAPKTLLVGGDGERDAMTVRRCTMYNLNR
jgi:hypothetical protein